jgi:hypothetical protein
MAARDLLFRYDVIKIVDPDGNGLLFPAAK